jgi:predicted nucleotidyltransferase
MSARRAPTLHDIRAKRRLILQILARQGARNPLVFGSVARGDAVAESDVDLLVEFGEDVPRGFDYFGMIFTLQEELGRLLGRPVHISEIGGRSQAAERILRDAVPL